ncbi:MAG: hypothetical protein CMQ54_02155 [Gammaproteobacteria bacterium]|nr:hypothetical protein [Gammaproteobacteria bacterium]|tara:strand:+ start:301 stop:1008 length:708 start_codon:yes stop_codon:yes gene_type:complete
MSTQVEVNSTKEAISEKSVSDYLYLHPDFFENNPELLMSLNLSHASGEAVSLIEHQITILRKKELLLQNRLNEFIDVAHNNDLLSKKIHELTLRLFGTNNLNEVVETLKKSMFNEFEANEAFLIIFDDKRSIEGNNIENFFQIINKQSKLLNPFKKFLSENKVACGKLRSVQNDFLFKNNTHEIKSSALIPIGLKSEIGFLVIGNTDINHFHPGMSVDFLKHLGDLVAGALKRYL